ncbi:DUF7144 family membrane protein [Agromyces bauzanensis]|uniref:DUF7144 domain-containing protein n=1 Tax=Agromyces bauzanensis TaxID=1308924 RepID=A0A917PPG4_9MICO|nr:hypothetical protein [Agromyces bauzanensis]GGJ86416.1 hypothetical protein GCM10011372_26050 [Agromyces bauzanensis]
MSDQFGPKRPLGVTIVAALAIVSGVFDIIGGIVLLTMQSDATAAERFGGAGLLIVVAVMSIVLGAIVLVVAWGLLRGDAVSRIAATVLQVISLAGSIWSGIAAPATLSTEILSSLLAIAILFLLWSGEATRYFRGLAPGEPTS